MMHWYDCWAISGLCSSFVLLLSMELTADEHPEIADDLRSPQRQVIYASLAFICGPMVMLWAAVSMVRGAVSDAK